MKKENRYRLAYGTLLLLLLLFLALNICAGSVSISVSEVGRVLTGRGTDTVFSDIILQIRFPRALAAAVLGGGLALSGYLLQTFFHNPIAGPFILGISSEIGRAHV